MKHHVYHAPGGGSIHAIVTERDPNYEQALNESGTLWRYSVMDDEQLPSSLLFYHHLDPKNPEHSARLAQQHLAPPNLHLHHVNGGNIVPMGQQMQIGGGIAGQVATRAEVDALRRAIAELMSNQQQLLAELKQRNAAPAAPAPVAPVPPAPAAPGGMTGEGA